MLDAVWAALGGAPAAPADLDVVGPAQTLPGPLPSTELATAAVASALLAAAELAEARSGHRPHVQLDTRHVADAVRSERFLRIDGAPPGSLFDPLSAFKATADGWVRLHANYPHHRAALLSVLGLPPEPAPDVDEAIRRIGRWAGSDLEDALAAAGGVGAVVRTPDEWLAHPAGRAVHGGPLVEWSPGAPAGSGWSARVTVGAGPAPAAPAAGLRVLDLTRVIAGPVATRTLAALGAHVLRVDPPQPAELPTAQMDTGPGKRTTRLDLRVAADAARLHQLLDAADVLVHGYRPGALAAHGLGRAELAERHPQLVTVTLSAWGETGPWGDRRGFDSIVQAASGIADLCRTGAGPGALPAQLLDHATGHLVAASALRALAIRQTSGRTSHARLSLATTADFLLSAPRVTNPIAVQAVSESHYAADLESAYGRLTQVSPPGRFDGLALSWPFGAHLWGTDEPTWLTPR